MDNFWIPRTLNAPMLFFIFQVDNFIVVTVIMVITGLLNIWYVGILVSILFVKTWNGLKEGDGQGLVMRFLYWHLPFLFGIKIQSNIREYIR